MSLPADERALQEAADWSLLLCSGEAGEPDRQRWRDWLDAQPEHAKAWARIEMVSRRLAAVPPVIAARALRPPKARGRRIARGVAPLMLLALAGFYGTAHNESLQWSAGAGQRLMQQAPDGTRVTLNNATDTDLRYGWRGRVLRLREGEVLVETAKDSRLWARPFAVETPQGRIEPLGTRFTVRLADGQTRVTVLDGRIRLRPRGQAKPVELAAGESTRFGGQGTPAPRTASPGDAAWLRGLVVADDQPLCEFLAEIQRYRKGDLHCDVSLRPRRITGVFAVGDPEQVLATVERTMNLRRESLPDEQGALVTPAY